MIFICFTICPDSLEPVEWKRLVSVCNCEEGVKDKWTGNK